MTDPHSLYQSYYPHDFLNTVHPDSHSFLIPLHLTVDCAAKALQTVFAPSAGLLYIYRPSKRRRTLNRAIDRLEESALPGYEYAIAYLYDKYRRNLTVSTISQTGRTLQAFLLFYHLSGRENIKALRRSDIAAYVEHEQERGLKINSVKNHLHTLYAFLQYLVDNEVLPADLLQKKIRIKLPEVLPRAIPDEDLKQILAVITNVRDRALILLLLHTGMRIGELLKVKMTDIIQADRKILLSVGEKNLHGRIVYYSPAAEQALKKWLATRTTTSNYLFYGNAGHELCYVAAWNIMKVALQKSGLTRQGYSLHSLRHTFATNMLNAGLRLEVLQQLLGHLTIDITLQYARIADITREEAYFKAMAIIEKGGNHEHDRVNPELQAVFEEKKLLRSHR